MKSIACFGLSLLLCTCAWAAEPTVSEDGFVSLFDGKTLNGWKANENAKTFQVKDGMIVVHGDRSHLYYVGPVNNHDFKNFHLRADVMTFPQANSGIFFHANYTESGWPKTGVESQINNSHRDPRRTGSLWNIKDIREAPAKDNVWFTQEIIVQGAHIVVKVDGKVVVDYTMPGDISKEHKLPSKLSWLPHGMIALQGHDPNSKVYFKNIYIKVLPD